MAESGIHALSLPVRRFSIAVDTTVMTHCDNDTRGTSKTVPDIEIIVVDDGSSDATARVAERALARFRGPWQVIRQASQGLPATRNVGYAASSGD